MCTCAEALSVNVTHDYDLCSMMGQPDFDGTFLVVQLSLETGQVLHYLNLSHLLFPPDDHWMQACDATLLHLDFDTHYLFAQFEQPLGFKILDLDTFTTVQFPCLGPSPVHNISLSFDLTDGSDEFYRQTTPLLWSSRSRFSVRDNVADRSSQRDLRCELSPRSYKVRVPSFARHEFTAFMLYMKSDFGPA